LEKANVNVLVLGDVVGDPGRKALFLSLPRLIKKHSVEFVLANGENAAGGFGITGAIASNFYAYGVDCITTGNHIWRNKEVFKIIDSDPKLIRPANYPNGTPGRGWTVIEKGGVKCAVLNLQCRVFMEPLDCPFRTARRELSHMRKLTNIIVVDLHGEATSEKMAMGWHLDGMVSAVVGTHTHVQTADERILPGRTAYITDVGMTGPFDSIIGMQKEPALKKFLTLLPSKFSVAERDIRINGVVIELERASGRAVRIERIDERISEAEGM